MRCILYLLSKEVSLISRKCFFFLLKNEKYYVSQIAETSSATPILSITIRFTRQPRKIVTRTCNETCIFENKRKRYAKIALTKDSILSFFACRFHDNSFSNFSLLYLLYFFSINRPFWENIRAWIAL